MRSTSGNNPITSEMTAGAGLRFLGGKNHKSIADCYGMSIRSCQRIVDNFLKAVDSDSQFDIRIPTTAPELSKCAQGWNRLSGASGMHFGVKGAIDGWLACIQKPNVDHPADYFSGHYQQYALNVQAVCDSTLRFVYFGFVGTGRTNNSRVFGRYLQLCKWLESTPDKYFLIRDNAYTLTNKMLIPFSDAVKHQIYNQSYNFCLLQLQVRIKMAFVRLTTKWRIFWRNLNFSMAKKTRIILAAGKLHNFVIDNNMTSTQTGTSRVPTVIATTQGKDQTE